MRPLLFDPDHGPFLEDGTVSIEDNLLQSRTVNNSSSKGKDQTQPRRTAANTTAKEHAQVAVVPNAVAFGGVALAARRQRSPASRQCEHPHRVRKRGPRDGCVWNHFGEATDSEGGRT